MKSRAIACAVKKLKAPLVKCIIQRLCCNEVESDSICREEVESASGQKKLSAPLVQCIIQRPFCEEVESDLICRE
jgi:hypothetical protein